MPSRFLCVLLSLSLAYSAPAVAQTESGELSQGIRQVEEGDLAAAIITLDGVVQKLAGVQGRTNELALAHLYLGMAHLGVSQWERAKTEMREAWRNNKGLKLDPKKFPPRVIQAYEEAKAEAASQPKPAGTPLPGPAKSPAETESSKKGRGSSKALLIVGGLGLAGGGLALAGGGGASPAVAATPRPTLTRQISLLTPSGGCNTASNSTVSLQMGAGTITRSLCLNFGITLNAGDTPTVSVLRVWLFQGGGQCLINYPDTPGVVASGGTANQVVSAFQYYAFGGCELPIRIDRIRAAVMTQTGGTTIVSADFATSITLSR